MSRLAALRAKLRLRRTAGAVRKYAFVPGRPAVTLPDAELHKFLPHVVTTVRGGGKPGKPIPGLDAPGVDPEIAGFLNNLMGSIDRGDHHRVNRDVARNFGFWLDESGDWRGPLMHNAADSFPSLMTVSRPDKRVPGGTVSVSTAGQGHEGVFKFVPHGVDPDGSQSQVRFAPAEHGEHVAHVISHFVNPDDPNRYHVVESILSRKGYGHMADAAKQAGVHFPPMPPEPTPPPREPTASDTLKFARTVKRYAAHPDEAAFHSRMANQPEDGTTPLVYADWLEEHDRPGMAALIRAHVAHGDWMRENGRPGDQFWQRSVHVQSNPHPGGAENIDGMNSVSITPSIGGMRWLSLAHQVQGYPHLWFHWHSGGMGSEKAESIARQLHAEGWPVRSDRAHGNATDFLNPPDQPPDDFGPDDPNYNRHLSRVVKRYAAGGDYSADDFHRHIASEPQNPFNALVYADWLQEHNMPAHERVVRAHAERYETGANVRPAAEYAHMTDTSRPWTTAVTSPNPSTANWKNETHTIYLSKRVPGTDQVLRWRINDLRGVEARDLIRELVREGGGRTPSGGTVELDNPTATMHVDSPLDPDSPPPASPTGDPQDAHLSHTIQRQGGTPAHYRPDRLARVTRRYARTESQAAHEKAVGARPHDATGWLTLADHMQDNGEPGAGAVREHGARVHAGNARVWDVVSMPGWMDYPNHYGNLWRAWLDRRYDESPATSDPRFVVRSVKPAGPGGSNSTYHPVLLTVNAHHAGLVHVPVNPGNVERIAADMGADGDVLRRVVRRTYGDPNEKLARATRRYARAGTVRRYMQYDHGDFHRKILEDRSQTVPALTYADFLAENGQEEAGELIREHVRQHTTPGVYSDDDPLAATNAGGYHVSWAARSTAPPDQFWVYTRRYADGVTNVLLDQKTDHRPAGLEWVAQIKDPAEADRLVNGIFAKGGTAHMGSHHQPAVPERPMTDEEIDEDQAPFELRPPEHLQRYAAKDKDVRAARRGKTGILGQIVKEVRRFTPEELDGLSVLVHPDGQVWIDEMDWHDGKAGGEIIKAAQKIVGKDNVTVVNEGGSPPGDGWMEATDEVDKKTTRKYAAYRAPAGGMIAPPVADPLFAGLPGQFYQGGKFVSGKSVLPQKKKFDMAAIRKKVRAKKLKPQQNTNPEEASSYARAVRRYAQADDRAAFEHAIDAEPHNATTHLVYADWLEENGEPDEAAFRRAMGEWVGTGGLDRSRSAAAGDELAEHFPFQVSLRKWDGSPDGGTPQGVHPNSFSYYYHGPNPEGDNYPSVYENDRMTDFHRNVQRQPTPVDARYHPLMQNFSWRNYRNMEEAFRRAFMANRPQQMARAVKRYAAGQSDVDAIKASMTPDDWRGSHGADFTKRKVLADAIQDVTGDDRVPNLLRSNRHLYLNPYPDGDRIKDAADLSRELNAPGRYFHGRHFNDPFIRQYLETALWSSNDNADERGGQPLDDNYGPEDIHPDTLAAMIADAHTFRSMNGHLLGDVDPASGGHNFWLSRNGHGTGFFDHGDRYGDAADELHDASNRHGEYDLYVGQDGMVHGSYEVSPTEANGPGDLRQFARTVRRYAMTGDPADEQAFHRSLIYDTQPGDMTPHLAYMDWLQENGREKLAGILRRNIQEQDRTGNGSLFSGAAGGIMPDSTTIGREYPATSESIGHVGHLSVHVAKPTRDFILLTATPIESFTDHADVNGSPFHYRALLQPNEAHDLADELRGLQGEAPWGEHETIGDNFRNYLRRTRMPDTRPRPTTPDVEARENPEQLARVVRRYAASPNDHAQFHKRINGKTTDNTAMKVYADFLEENAPEQISEHANGGGWGVNLTDFLRTHNGPAWVGFGPDGKVYGGRRWTMPEIRQHMNESGSHWFDRQAMQFFGTRIHGQPFHGPGGVYFVTSEQPPHGARGFTVRSFQPARPMEGEGAEGRSFSPSIGTFVLVGHPDLRSAQTVARRLASGQSVDRANAAQMAGQFPTQPQQMSRSVDVVRRYAMGDPPPEGEPEAPSEGWQQENPHAPFHRAIIESRSKGIRWEKMPAHVYADYLEENGKPVLARIIRSSLSGPVSNVMVYDRPETWEIDHGQEPTQPNTVYVYDGGETRGARNKRIKLLQISVKSPDPDGPRNGLRHILSFNYDGDATHVDSLARELLAEGHPAGNNSARRRLPPTGEPT